MKTITQRDYEYILRQIENATSTDELRKLRDWILSEFDGNDERAKVLSIISRKL